MKKIIVVLLVLISTSSFAAKKLTESEIRQITVATQEYMKVGNLNWVCDDKIVAEARINLSEEVSQNDQFLVTHGKITFRCHDQTMWKDGEACELNRDTSEKNSLWTIEYCDT